MNRIVRSCSGRSAFDGPGARVREGLARMVSLDLDGSMLEPAKHRMGKALMQKCKFELPLLLAAYQGS